MSNYTLGKEHTMQVQYNKIQNNIANWASKNLNDRC